MLNKIAWIWMLLILCLRGNAQSYHFSQFYTTPLLNNPAFTGYIDEPYRVAANFRSQWAQGKTPYLTNSLSVDLSGFRNIIPEGHKAGVGIYMVNDKSLGGALQTNTISLSTAYNLLLDPGGENSIGAGLQGTYSQRRIDFSRLSFENQFGSNGYDASLPIGESINSYSTNYFDVSAGLLYNFHRDYHSFFGSFSIYNALQHKENLQMEAFKLPPRYSFMAGGQMAIGYEGTVYSVINYMQQGRASNLTIGAAYGYQLGIDKKQELSLGLWHRVKDALIPYIGYELNGFKFGLSYDYTISRLKSLSETRNGYELTLVYKGEDKSELKRLIPWY